MDLNEQEVIAFRLRGYQWNEIAEHYDITRRQLTYWRETSDFEDPLVWITDSVEDNEILDRFVYQYLSENGHRGERYTMIYIQTKGYYVTRQLLRNSIWRVDPIGRFNRRPGARISRVVYSVAGPGHLAHMDGW